MLKKIGQKILVAYASAKIEAKVIKEKSDKRKEQKSNKKKKEKERQASVYCPYCGTYHSSSKIYKDEYNSTELKLRSRDSETYISLSFISCQACGLMFGIKETISDFGINSIRYSFRLKGD